MTNIRKISITLLVVAFAVTGTMAIIPTEKASAHLSKSTSQNCYGSAFCLSVNPTIVIPLGNGVLKQSYDQTCHDKSQCAQVNQQNNGNLNAGHQLANDISGGVKFN